MRAPISTVAIAVCLSAAFAFPAMAWSQDTTSRYTLRVFTKHAYTLEYTYSWTETKGVWPFTRTVTHEEDPEERTASMHIRGSAWALDVKGEQVLVTAAHCLGLNVPMHSTIANETLKKDGSIKTEREYVISDECKALSRTTESVFGSLAFKAKDVGTVNKAGSDDILDVAFVRPDDKAVFSDLRLLPMAKETVSVQEKVMVFGFPSTSSQQMKEVLVADVDRNHGYCVLNEALDEGYSGGIVVNKNGQSVGLITNVSKGQTTVLLLTPEVLGQIKWHNAATVLEKKF